VKLTEARATLVAAVELATAPDVNVYDHLPDQLAVPAVLIGWGTPWFTVDTICGDLTVEAELVVVAGRIDYGPQLAGLEQVAADLLAGLAGDADWETPTAPTGPYALDVAGVTYLAATLTTSATADP